jgi:predicted dehydrogenase
MLRGYSRRRFLQTATATLATVSIVPSKLVRGYAANEKVNIGIIGAGGRGGANLRGVSSENIVALCDIDHGRLESAARNFEGARTYTDYRQLLDNEKSLDAVVCSAPDHHHAPACVRAMRGGLHCYCEKPLTHDIYEARLMTQLAEEKQLVTHMGTPSRGKEDTVRAVELIRAGVLGTVSEAHFWTNRPIWPQGFDRPAGEDAVPEHIDWESWIGSAPMRPFVEHWPADHSVYGLPKDQRRGNRRIPVYHPFVWRGWWDFGTGALGDIAPHSWHSAYWGLELGAPTSAEVVESSGPMTEMFPLATVIRFDFPAKGDRPAVKLFWHDGGKKPSPEMLGGQIGGGNGSLIIGTKATLGTGHNSVHDFPDVERSLRRPGDMYEEWIAGIKTSDPQRPSCPFSYAGPLTEAYLLGNIALKADKCVQYDAAKMRITNCEAANQYLKREYRKGWEI